MVFRGITCGNVLSGNQGLTCDRVYVLPDPPWKLLKVYKNPPISVGIGVNHEPCRRAQDSQMWGSLSNSWSLKVGHAPEQGSGVQQQALMAEKKNLEGHSPDLSSAEHVEWRLQKGLSDTFHSLSLVEWLLHPLTVPCSPCYIGLSLTWQTDDKKNTLFIKIMFSNGFISIATISYFSHLGVMKNRFLVSHAHIPEMFILYVILFRSASVI